MGWLTPADPEELAELLTGRPGDAPPVLSTGADALPEAVGGASGAAEAGPAAPRAVDDGARSAAAEVDVLSTAPLAGLREIRPRDLTVAVGGGTRVPDLLTDLAGEGVWVPLGGPALGMSLGGLAAAAPAGPFDQSFGDLRRQLLACGLVGWNGERLRWGRAVMKDVAGYSMVRSVAGSFGRTGVLHRATLRLWPAPEALAAPVVASGDGDGGVPDPLAAAGSLATSDADASVRPDAAVWSWSPDGPAGGRLEVRLVGSEASVALRLEKLRSWAAGRDAGLENGEAAAFDPLAAGGGIDGATPAAGLPAAGGARDPGVTVVAVRAGRADFADAARRILRALGDLAVGLEGYPMSGHLRCAFRREGPAGGTDGAVAVERATAPDGVSGATAASRPFARLLDAAGDAPVRVERGTASELEAIDARRSEGARRLEARVLEGLEGRPRHWLSSYL